NRGAHPPHPPLRGRESPLSLGQIGRFSSPQRTASSWAKFVTTAAIASRAATSAGRGSDDDEAPRLSRSAAVPATFNAVPMFTLQIPASTAARSDASG